MEINTESTISSNEKLQRKRGILQGIVSIILWFIIMIGMPKMLSIFLTGETFFQELATYIPFVILTIVFAISYFATINKDIQRLTKSDIKTIIIMAIIYVIVGNGLSWIFEITGLIFDNQDSFEGLLASYVIPTSLIALIYGPLVEELVFRRALGQVVANKIIFTALSGLLFGFIHASNITIIIYIILGVLLAITYLRTNKNIIASISVHFISNLVGVIILLLGF